MKPEEINKIIAEYMGLPWCGLITETMDRYTAKNKEGETFNVCFVKSLDALMPVVEKLLNTNYYFDLKFMPDDEHTVYIWKEGHCVKEVVSESPSLALATACAKAILELKE